jgi:hypothetical protein
LRHRQQRLQFLVFEYVRFDQSRFQGTDRRSAVNGQGWHELLSTWVKGAGQ